MDHNRFHGSPGGQGEYEAIWLAGSHAWAAFDKTGFVVDHNLFENWNGDNEVIAVKTSGVTIANNRLVGSRDFNLRMGEGNLLKNNVLEARGIVVYGKKAKGWERSDAPTSARLGPPTP